MKLEHGFTTREEWEEFFNQYYASIRLINQKANELLHTKDGVESWIEKYKDCSALQRSIYVSGNQRLHPADAYHPPENIRYDAVSAVLSIPLLYKDGGYGSHLSLRLYAFHLLYRQAR